MIWPEEGIVFNIKLPENSTQPPTVTVELPLNVITLDLVKEKFPPTTRTEFVMFNWDLTIRLFVTSKNEKSSIIKGDISIINVWTWNRELFVIVIAVLDVSEPFAQNDSLP